MVSYPSLQNISYVETQEGPALCEVSGLLLSSLPPRVASLVSSYPACDQSHKQSEMRQAGLKTDTASLFLPREGGSSLATEGSVTSLLTLILQGGVEGLLNNVTTALGQGLSELSRLVMRLQSSLYPHLKLSASDMISEYSNTRAWTEAHIRCIAWHPHTTKLAVAYRDDSISVLSLEGGATQPVLKHAAMKGVSAMSWRPLSSSHLAVACQGGVAVWTLDPSSLVSRPSSSCLTRLASSGHAPVTQVEWSPDGRLLASASPADTRIHIWSLETRQSETIARVGGGGASLLRWSQDTRRLFCASPGTVFRVWDTDTWSPDRWTVGGGSGRVAASAWSPDSDHLLFATSEEPVLYCVSFQGQGEAAVPLMDLSKVCLESGETGGGLVQDIQWDPTGHRLAVTFKETNSVCLMRSKPGQARLSPIGWVSGCGEAEFPVTAQFQRKAPEYGALLTVVWSSERVQHLPLVFSQHEDILAEIPETTVEELFTQY